ncbi:MAG: DUF2079 domain-containing protein [Anaerolineae bacterium]|nr:DUF2079 domain-containing protein [Anaerolineae bacterium]
MSNSRITPHASRLPGLLLILLILTYILYFSWYSLHRHNTLHSYAADLSLIDQPMWNTVIGPGGFMELTWGNQQQPRLAEHFEPILIPLALLFFLWDDVRILLIAQSIALALGALPVFWIARRELSTVNGQLSIANPPSSIFHPPSSSWSALAFAAAYLLFPHLQAANMADFHADPFVVAPLLFAFWYATQRRWGWMWVWAIIAMATKETLPTLTGMLGLWLIVTGDRGPETGDTSNSTSPVSRLPSPVRLKPKMLHGLALIAVSAVWFFVATFLIVAPLARHYFETDGPIYLSSRYTGDNLLALLQEPPRWGYLLGLLAAAGFLPLLAPELLLIGLPVLAANMLSSFAGQYSGEQHYSAPLVAVFMVAAIYGASRLINKSSLYENNGQVLKITTLIYVTLWLLAWSLGYHAGHGWTPFSGRMEIYSMRPAAAQLPQFIRQIPAEAVVSASAALHPHLAHRRVIYVFPTVQEADYLLVDVTDIPGVHPNDAHTKIMDLLAADWQLLQADQGLLLAQKSPHASTPSASAVPPMPDSFFDFARSTTLPAYPTQLTFGSDQLRLLGYDVHDDPDNGVSFCFYWQSEAPLPDDTRLWPLIYDDTGRLLSDPTQVPMIAAVWYPPAKWQRGEIVVTETLPQLLPDIFHLGLAAGPERGFAAPGQRLPITTAPADAIRFDSGRWVQLATFKRYGLSLTRQAARLKINPLALTKVRFGPAIRLTGFDLDPANLQPGATLPVLLRWTTDQPLPTDYTVFLHLLAADGRLVAQHDAFPTWLTPQPTSHWLPRQPVLDRHELKLPADLAPGSYTLQMGLYNVQTLQRLPLPDGSDVFMLGQLQMP